MISWKTKAVWLGVGLVLALSVIPSLGSAATDRKFDSHPSLQG